MSFLDRAGFPSHRPSVQHLPVSSKQNLSRQRENIEQGNRCGNIKLESRFTKDQSIKPEARRNRRTTVPAKPKAPWPSPESRTLLRDLPRKWFLSRGDNLAMLFCWPSKLELSFPAHRHSAKSSGFVSGKIQRHEEKFRVSPETGVGHGLEALALLALKQCKMGEL